MNIDATVIIPTTGDRPAMLLRAIASVRDQTVQTREVIVVVDAARDVARTVHAALVAASFETTQVLCTERRRGASAARNLGAKAAKGGFLCFLDDDDRWKPEYLERAFAGGDEVDLVLTGFEKHTPHGVYPEKTPCPSLQASCFVVKNPGIRGSNVVVRASVYAAVGGFDEELVSFNDVDFGVRTFSLPRLRYRAVQEPLVEYHAHGGERLSKRGSDSIQRGMQQFLSRYEHVMSAAEQAAFRERARRNWDIDPWHPTALLDRLRNHRARTAPLFRAADEQVLEALDHGDAAVDRSIAAVEELCAARARQESSLVKRLRIAVISTEGSAAAGSLLASLRSALHRSCWRPSLATDDAIEALVLENDSVPRGALERRAAIEDATGAMIRVHFARASSTGEVLSTARARAALFRAIRDRGWVPSPSEPVWVLDDDLRFEQLLPSLELGFRVVQPPSLLHRMEFMIARHPGADALVCGNSGAAPVPALGLLAPQLRDLCAPKHAALWLPQEARKAALTGGHYYGFASEPTNVDSPRAWRCAWWRDDRVWLWSEVEDRLRKGLPVTRPALAVQSSSTSCWGPFAPPRVAGGNTILLSPRALVADWLGVARSGGIESRRADSVWCQRATREGAEFVQVSIPLLHNRAPRGDGSTSNLLRDAVSDALGVALYQAIEHGQGNNHSHIGGLARARLAQAKTSVGVCIERLRWSDTPLQESLLPTLQDVSLQLEEVRFDDIQC